MTLLQHDAHSLQARDAAIKAFQDFHTHTDYLRLVHDVNAIGINSEDAADLAVSAGLLPADRVNDFLSVCAEPRPSEPSERQRISLTDLTAAVDATIKLLVGKEIFQRGGVLVDCVRGALPGDVEPNGAMSIRTVPTPRLREVINQLAEFERLYQRRSVQGSWQEAVIVPPPKDLVATIEARGQWNGIRPLVGVIAWPALRPDGSILAVPGYDGATGLYSINDVTITVPAKPTQDDARAAADILLEVVGDFRFVNDAARTAWLAGLLTLLARPAIDGPTPMFEVDANIRGAGKGLACDAISTIALGRPMSKLTAPSSEEEWTKLLSSIGLAGEAVTCVDNVTHTLRSNALDTVLTSLDYEARLLGKNQTAKIPWRTVVFCTSNNAQLSADLVRRTVQVRLDVDTDRPEERTGFRNPDLLGYCLANRARLLSAAFTLLRAYHVAGRPSVKMRPMGSYERWSSVVRAALVWVGLQDPAETQDALRESADADSEPATSLLGAWFSVYGSEHTTSATILKRIANPEEPGADVETLRDAVCAFADLRMLTDPTNGRKFGNALAKIRGRHAGGYKLERRADVENSKGVLWRVVPTGTRPTSTEVGQR